MKGFHGVKDFSKSVTQDCLAPANDIVRENCLEGSGASEWDINAAGSSLIQGFATKGSYAVGEEVVFKVKTASSALPQGCGAMAMATVWV